MVASKELIYFNNNNNNLKYEFSHLSSTARDTLED